MLVIVAGVLIILLPFGSKGLIMLYDWILVQQAHQFLEQVLPSAYISLDPAALGDGRLIIVGKKADAAIRSNWKKALPASLAGRLELLSVKLSYQLIPLVKNHWMADDQPRYLPTISIYAVLTDHQGKRIPLQQAIELLID